MREVLATCVPGVIPDQGRKELIGEGCQIEREGERMRILWPEGTSFDSFSNTYALASGKRVCLRTIMRESWLPEPGSVG